MVYSKVVNNVEKISRIFVSIYRYIEVIDKISATLIKSLQIISMTIPLCASALQNYIALYGVIGESKTEKLHLSKSKKFNQN